MLRIIGDVHGRNETYLKLAKNAQFSIQIGDMGFSYEHLKRLDPKNHVVLLGNHDNYSQDSTGKFIYHTPHILGDYGKHSVAGYDFFYMRGGYSIDWKRRDFDIDWWPLEELSYQDCIKALTAYSEVRPEYVISHECPARIIDMFAGHKTWDGELIRPSRTANLLDQMWEIHQPKKWFFGHHHRDWAAHCWYDKPLISTRGTEFRCLAELSFLDLPSKEDK